MTCVRKKVPDPYLRKSNINVYTVDSRYVESQGEQKKV
jgi:hypothetical protein